MNEYERIIAPGHIKRRGDVVLTAAYSYATERGLSYNELVLSVQEVDPLQLGPVKQAIELQSDATVITVLEACIAEGINTKMKMIDAASKRASASTRATLKVLDTYTGKDTSLHHWTFVVRERGAKVYELLERAPAEHTAESALMTP